MSEVIKFPLEQCYNCNKKETLSQGVAEIEKVQVELENYSDDEEMFMPLCPECCKKWEKGELKGIEEKWKTEKEKGKYSSTIGQWEGDYGSIRVERKSGRTGIQKMTGSKMEIIQFDSREKLRRFMESNGPIAELAEGEGSYYGDTCDQCDKEFEVIISGGSVNYYLCSEHFNQLKEKLCRT